MACPHYYCGLRIFWHGCQSRPRQLQKLMLVDIKEAIGVLLVFLFANKELMLDNLKKVKLEGHQLLS